MSAVRKALRFCDVSSILTYQISCAKVPVVFQDIDTEHEDRATDNLVKCHAGTGHERRGICAENAGGGRWTVARHSPNVGTALIAASSS